MGKKSGQSRRTPHAPQASKPAGPVNNTPPTWEDLEELYTSAATGIIEMGNKINDVLRNPALAYAPDKAELNLAVKGFNQDIMALTNELVELHDRHKEKHGEITSGEELAEYLSTGEDYVGFNNKFTQLVPPLMLAITEQADVALQIMDAQAQAEPPAASAALSIH
jgi:hypothetical protein